MKAVKVFKVKLAGVRSISPKALVVIANDNPKEVIIPRIAYFGEALAMKGGAHWIAEWILDKNKIQHSKKKPAWYDPETESIRIVGQKGHFEKVHIPKPLQPLTNVQPNDSLTRKSEEGH